MPDNVSITPGAGARIASREVGWSGETAQMQVVALGTTTGSDDERVAQEVGAGNPLPIQEAASASSLLMRILLRLLSPAAWDRGTDRTKVTAILEANQGLNVVSTVSTVTNVGTLGGVDARPLIIATERDAFRAGVRSRIF
jgi:Na+-translocating ferredoxin:NAD+ oxidoreductase RnfG subunit